MKIDHSSLRKDLNALDKALAKAFETGLNKLSSRDLIDIFEMRRGIRKMLDVVDIKEAMQKNCITTSNEERTSTDGLISRIKGGSGNVSFATFMDFMEELFDNNLK